MHDVGPTRGGLLDLLSVGTPNVPVRMLDLRPYHKDVGPTRVLDP